MIPSFDTLDKEFDFLNYKFFQVLELVERGSVVIDWNIWRLPFVMVEALGAIEEDPRTDFNMFVHRYRITPVGKQFLEWHKKRKKQWPYNLIFSVRKK